MSPNPLTPGLEFFKTCLSAFWKPEWKHGNVLKNGTILNYLAGILHPMHGLGVLLRKVSWCRIAESLVARSGEIWSRILFGRRGCRAGKPHVQFYVSVDFVIGRLHISQILQIALIQYPYIAWQLYFLGTEGVERWSSRVSRSDQGLRKGKPSLRLQSGAIQQRPNALQCMGGSRAKWE